ncbi:unnamed protein product [Heligmosomoides polygyrus]|uniref:Uncharacterized protein n=1 Tax=Heligmosomoides polygyrus TaxID=6339 RepID=A0A3P7ZB56_HELPZ|nr:unnamed protein product [Heligmosomoides polygyrus]
MAVFSAVLILVVFLLIRVTLILRWGVYEGYFFMCYSSLDPKTFYPNHKVELQKDLNYALEVNEFIERCDQGYNFIEAFGKNFLIEPRLMETYGANFSEPDDPIPEKLLVMNIERYESNVEQLKKNVTELTKELRSIMKPGHGFAVRDLMIASTHLAAMEQSPRELDLDDGFRDRYRHEVAKLTNAKVARSGSDCRLLSASENLSNQPEGQSASEVVPQNTQQISVPNQQSSTPKGQDDMSVQQQNIPSSTPKGQDDMSVQQQNIPNQPDNVPIQNADAHETTKTSYEVAATTEEDKKTTIKEKNEKEKEKEKGKANEKEKEKEKGKPNEKEKEKEKEKPNEISKANKTWSGFLDFCCLDFLKHLFISLALNILSACPSK